MAHPEPEVATVVEGLFATRAMDKGTTSSPFGSSACTVLPSLTMPFKKLPDLGSFCACLLRNVWTKHLPTELHFPSIKL